MATSAWTADYNLPRLTQEIDGFTSQKLHGRDLGVVSDLVQELAKQLSGSSEAEAKPYLPNMLKGLNAIPNNMAVYFEGKLETYYKPRLLQRCSEAAENNATGTGSSIVQTFLKQQLQAFDPEAPDTKAMRSESAPRPPANRAPARAGFLGGLLRRGPASME